MDKNSKVYVAGHNGLVGSAITRDLRKTGYNNIIAKSSKELDLTRQSDVEVFFEREKPDVVVLAAAKVGGIYANNTYPADFIDINLQIQCNVIRCAYNSGAEKLLFLGSSCIYPKFAPQPMKEEYLLTGSLEPTNLPYAVAKLAGMTMIDAYNRQYGTQYFSVLPTNLYGINDNFDIETSHVLPALLRKIHDAKIQASPTVEVWGTGQALREFLFVDDLADACVFLLENYKSTEAINIGFGEDISISDLAELICDVVDYRGEIVYNTNKHDGTPKKLLDCSKIHSLGWRAKTSLRDGISKTYEWYCEGAK